MAQAGHTSIVTYNTATASAVPSAGNLTQGELAVNVTDRKIYTKNSGGSVIQVGSGPSATETLTNKTITAPLGIVKADVGLGNVDNTSDANKPISTATQTALNLKVNAASPTFTGTMTVDGLISKGPGSVATNLAIGQSALFSNTTGSNNIALGYEALYSTLAGSYNVGIGTSALRSCTNTGNVAIGYSSMQSTTTGAGNTAVGYSALGGNGYYNVAIGRQSLANLTTGSGNLEINATDQSGNYAPAFNITNQNNRISMGHTAITNAYIQVAWTVLSDARDKMEIFDVPLGLSFVEKLKPVSYRFRENRDSDVGYGPTRYGFLAQDILALEGANSVIVDAEDPEKLRFNDQALVAVLVKAIQELKADFEAYKASHP